MANRFLEKYFPHVENLLVPDTWLNRYRFGLCKRKGHKDVGPYYNMQQSSCWRCGVKSWAAIESVPEWSQPDHSMY